MPSVPAIGRLDLTLASLLVVERHRTLRLRHPDAGEVSRDVLAVADHVDVSAECFADLETFRENIEHALDRLVEAGWLSRLSEEGEERFGAEEMAEHALAWIRARLARDRDLLHEYERLDYHVTERILGAYADAGEDDGDDEDYSEAGSELAVSG